MKARHAAAAAGFAVTVVSATAMGGSMDPALERLVVDPGCRTEAGEIRNHARCLEDNAAFKLLVNQYGFAFAPNPTNSARTTGFGGFHVSIEAAYTSIDDSADYWRRGTRGAVDPSSNRASVVNTGPAQVLQLYSVKLRKSFGFGLEIAGMVGFMAETSILSGGADVRLSLLEGFRKSVPGYLPDVAVGGGVRTITGTPQFQLTVAGLDVQLSKPFPIADSSIITPYVGYQYLWIYGDSGLVDLTPATDPLGYCNYSGPHIPGNDDPGEDAASQQYDGRPVCQGGSSQDFNNNRVFDRARLERERLLLGVNYRYEMVILGLTFITDFVDPAAAQAGGNSTLVYPDNDPDATPVRISDEDLLADEPRQWTLVLQLGTMF
jgi:hypothetical protein